jgi:hypothetical protein
MPPDEIAAEFDDFGSETDPLFDAGVAAEAPLRDRRSLAALVWALVRRPRSALTEVAERGRWLWLVPVIAIALLSTASAAVSIPRAREAQMAEMTRQMERAAGDMTEEEAAELEASRDQALGIMFRVTGIFTVVGAVVAPFLAVLIATAILHLGGTVVGGQQTFGQMLAAVSWARWPLAFQAALRMFYAFTGGYDARANGLSGLVATDSPLGPPLAEISVWNVWALALTVLAVAVVSKVSTGKAVAVVAALVVLRLALGEVGVAAARLASGFGG